MRRAKIVINIKHISKVCIRASTLGSRGCFDRLPNMGGPRGLGNKVLEFTNIRMKVQNFPNPER